MLAKFASSEKVNPKHNPCTPTSGIYKCYHTRISQFSSRGKILGNLMIKYTVNPVSPTCLFLLMPPEFHLRYK